MNSERSAESCREEIRLMRQALTAKEQKAAERLLLSRFMENQQVQRARHVALYFSVKGEIKTKHLMHYCWQQGIRVYLPALHPFSKGHLLFLRYKTNDPLILNHYGIPEPKLNLCNLIPANNLDLIFAPLVAFDGQGNRLGMGGGYYDRLFAYASKPVRIGLAHDFQKVEKLVVNHWDIPLTEVLTPSKNWIFDTHIKHF